MVTVGRPHLVVGVYGSLPSATTPFSPFSHAVDRIQGLVCDRLAFNLSDMLPALEFSMLVKQEIWEKQKLNMRVGS
jgi:hypothetical protein